MMLPGCMRGRMYEVKVPRLRGLHEGVIMMNRWTNKYSYGPGSAAGTPARVLGGRLRSVVLAVLLVAVIVLGVVGGQAIAYRSKCEPAFVYRMQTECKEALSSLKGLSRSTGGNSEDQATLGRIRANIHAIDAINEINNTIEGGRGYYVDAAVFTQLYDIINSYHSNLKLGSEVVADWDRLDRALAELSEMLMALR